MRFLHDLNIKKENDLGTKIVCLHWCVHVYVKTVGEQEPTTGVWVVCKAKLLTDRS